MASEKNPENPESPVSPESPESLEILQIPLKDRAGGDKGSLPLPATRLDCRVRKKLLKEAVVMYEANCRVGTHETKTRGQVAGSNKKPWRQKGTGRARAGTRKSPLWRGGGTIFGPHPRDYSYGINRKQRRLAVRSALLSKVRDGQVMVLEELKLEAPSSKSIARALKAIGVTGPCMIGTGVYDRNLALSARNIPGVVVTAFKDFNARDVLRVRTVILLREAFEALKAAGGACVDKDSGDKDAVDKDGGDKRVEGTA